MNRVAFEPRNTDFAARTQASFARQAFMATLGARLETVEPGQVTIALDHRPDLCQQHGFFHGGVVGTLADNAGGYASFSLLAEEDSILTMEYKVNLMAPAKGEKLIVHGAVVRAGKTVTVARADVEVINGGVRVPCATMLGTFMTLHGKPDHANSSA